MWLRRQKNRNGSAGAMSGELAVNWINDEDNPYGESKIWCYFSR